MNYLILLIILFGCSNQKNERAEGKVNDSQPQLNVDKPARIDTLREERKYVFENDSLKQAIKIKDVAPNTISFEYIVTNKKTNCSVSLSGKAIDKNPDMDPELDEDEEGFGYPAIQYFYNKNDCVLAIRRAMIEKDKIQITVEGCSKETTCPIESVGILR